MITNLHEQRTARRKLTELETALARHREHRPAHRDREMHDLVGAGFESQIEELSVELDTYDQLASGADETATIAAGTLASQTQHAGETLISARIAAGLSQQQLANSVGVHEGVIRRYERERYRSTSLARIDEIACALAQPKAVTSVPPPTGDGEWIAASREAVREASRQLLSRRLTKAKRPGNLERQVIALRFFERLSITSIANEVGISIDEAHQIVEAVNAELRVLLQSFSSGR